MQNLSKKCSRCHKIHLITDMQSLPFAGLVCDGCISLQCNVDQDDDELSTTDFSVDNFSVMFNDMMQKPKPRDESLGRKLNALKQSMITFAADVKNYKEIIRRKIELTRIEIFINSNFCKNKLERQRISETQQLDRYKKEVTDLLNADVFTKLKENAAKHAENFNKISNNAIRVSLMEMDNFIKTLKEDLKRANLILFSNKQITYEIPERSDFHILVLGSLKFNDCAELEANNVIKDFLETSPYFHSITSKPIILKARSCHILFESLILVCYENLNEITLKRFHLKNSHISYEDSIRNPVPIDRYLTGNNQRFFVSCLSFEDGTYELNLYDELLKLKQFVSLGNKAGFKPISIHMNLDVLFVFMAGDSHLEIKSFNLDLKQTSSDVQLFGIQKLCNSFDTENFSTKGFGNFIFIKQKFLLGNRITIVDFQTNTVQWRVDLNYFFDKFYVDLVLKQVTFFCQGRIYVYDIQMNKYVKKMSFLDSDKGLCEFDYFRDGEIYFLTPYE